MDSKKNTPIQQNLPDFLTNHAHWPASPLPPYLTQIGKFSGVVNFRLYICPLPSYFLRGLSLALRLHDLVDSWIVLTWKVFDSWTVPAWSLKNKELFWIGLVDLAHVEP